MCPKDATFCSIILFKVQTVHFKKGMINERGDVSMLHQITKKKGVVSLVWKRHSQPIFRISKSTLKM